MKHINDSSYKKIFELKKYKDLFDFSSLECRIALIVTLVLDALFCMCSYFFGADFVVGECVKILDNIGISLIGFLGFIVTGLAILTGAISSKVVKKLQNRNKMNALERILLSFYLVGLLTAVVIVVTFVLYFIVIIPIKSIFIFDMIILSILSYLIIFIIFYAVKLIGNCLELFYIVNNMQLVDDNNVDYKGKYNNYRIAALEKMQLSVTSIEKIKEYKREIAELIITDNISLEERQILLKMLDEQFGE